MTIHTSNMSSSICNESSILHKPIFSVRIVVCDHYLTKPIPGLDVIYSEFRGSDIKQVPVLRIFGPAPDGFKACLHVHGVFPYFYVPCPTPNPAPQFLYQIASSLDKALNIALKQANSSTQHVYKISLVKGLPFYGYHDVDHLYLKVFLYNPGLIKQAVELCSNGAILGQVLQPHESHLNFTLQFFIDFNLFGMSNIDLQNIQIRKQSSNSQSNDIFSESPIESGIKPESVCHYEADCMASHIINRLRIGKGDGIENPGLEEVWNQEMERRKHLNVSLASKSLSQGRLKTETDSHYKFDEMFRIKMSNIADEPINVINNNVDIVHYPAINQEGSQVFSAVDVSVHHPSENSIGRSSYASIDNDNNTTLTNDLDDTVVDEAIAMNSSLSIHYSQIALDSEDLDLVDILKDMEDNSIEEDSILGTPGHNELEKSDEDDDKEYSQIYDEETLILDPNEKSNDDENNMTQTNWNDTFWNNAEIPQLDGTCDDEHTKKVRKRKRKPTKLNVTHIVAKSKLPKENVLNNDNIIEVKKEKISEEDEIVLSQNNFKVESNITDEFVDEKIIHIKTETSYSNENVNLNQTILEDNESELNVASIIFKRDAKYEHTDPNISMTDLVEKQIIKKLNASELYDIQHNLKSIAGPSGMPKSKLENINNINSSFESTSSEDNNLGIVSFYNMSKMCNITLDNSDNEFNLSQDVINFKSPVEDLNCNEDVTNVCNNSQLINKSVVWIPKIKPLTTNEVVSSLNKYKIPQNRYAQPYYSNYKDVGDKIAIGRTVLKVVSHLPQDQKAFETNLGTRSIEEWRQLMFLKSNDYEEFSMDENALKLLLADNRPCVLGTLKKPPTTFKVLEWIKNKELKNDELEKNKNSIVKNLDELENSQAIGLDDDVIDSSLSIESTEQDKNTCLDSLHVTIQTDGSYLCFGSGISQIEEIDAPIVERNFLTIMVLEVLTNIRGDFHPDPQKDSMIGVFLSVSNDCPDEHFLDKKITEIIIVDKSPNLKLFDRCGVKLPLKYVHTELDLIQNVIDFVRKHNPDIMCGYEIEMSSWGYFIERSQILGLEIIMELSRITEKYRQKRLRGNDNDFEGKILGRITFNVWRLFRYELALSSYSFENCMSVILNERVPQYTYSQINKWWNDPSRTLRWVPIEYYMTKISGTLRMLEKLDITNRTSELARLFGLQWWEVLSRGSQFRVESLMLRAARPLNLVALSPTVKQRAAMKAPECLPLIFEPESRYYADPVIVLDFQSLYPSMMIAYNYCFSTCIGRVQNINGDTSYEFGAWRLRIPKSKLETLVNKDLVHWSPVGAGFVKAEVRRGVLPALLRRILAARQAVKKNMKKQTDEDVKKAMHSRQLGLKLIANVTYGYTAANFSGRMPCVEVGDSVVSKGRETLERAIRLVENSNWNAKVVYGDTDSMFVVVPGGTKEEAFRIGQEIADAVTADNPSPVVLKLEKVYQPCILQTKKRYVGFMYETPEQVKPVFEAKGIETVRRDGCPAGVKLLQNSLCELFTSCDISKIKLTVQKQLRDLVNGMTPLPELLFTREYHGPQGYRPGASAPPNEIAKRMSSRDPRSAPRSGWRVSWVVAAGSAPLVRLARSPLEASREQCRLHVTYYATRVLLPPLNRCFSLVGVNVFKWWSELAYTVSVGARSWSGIARYMCRGRCAGCGARGAGPVCGRCAGRGARGTVAILGGRRARTDRHVLACREICQSCCGHVGSKECINVECPVLWRRQRADSELTEICEIFTHLPPNLRPLEF